MSIRLVYFILLCTFFTHPMLHDTVICICMVAKINGKKTSYCQQEFQNLGAFKVHLRASHAFPLTNVEKYYKTKLIKKNN